MALTPNTSKDHGEGSSRPSVSDSLININQYHHTTMVPSVNEGCSLTNSCESSSSSDLEESNSDLEATSSDIEPTSSDSEATSSDIEAISSDSDHEHGPNKSMPETDQKHLAVLSFILKHHLSGRP